MTFWIRRIIFFASLAPIITPSLAQATSPLPPAPAKTMKKFVPFKGGVSLNEILHRHGFTDRQLAIINRQNPLPKGLSLSHGEGYRLRMSPDHRFAEVKIYEAPRNLAYIYWRNNDTAGCLVKNEALKVKERTISGKVNGSILGALLQALPSRWIAHRFLDAYSFDFNVPRQLQRGARFTARLETKWDGLDLVGYGEILETSLEIGGRNARRYFVAYLDGGTFIDPENAHQERPLFAPVTYLHISSFFEPRRFHPIKRRRQPHLGVDFELAEGTPVYTAEAGVVLRSGRQRAAGNFVVIRHASGIETSYDHMRALANRIFPGATVENGQQVGEVGCTGYCTKAHLHFAVKRLGRYVDPIRYLKNYPFHSVELIGYRHSDLKKAWNH